MTPTVDEVLERLEGLDGGGMNWRCLFGHNYEVIYVPVEMFISVEQHDGSIVKEKTGAGRDYYFCCTRCGARARRGDGLL